MDCEPSLVEILEASLRMMGLAEHMGDSSGVFNRQLAVKLAEQVVLGNCLGPSVESGLTWRSDGMTEESMAFV